MAAASHRTRDNGSETYEFEDGFDEPSWISENIPIRQCVYYVPSAKDPLTCDCGAKKSDHEESFLPVEGETRASGSWNATQHTKEIPNNTYGEIAFSVQERFAKYVRVSNTVDMDKMMSLLFDVWQLKMPNLIISVTGGALDFKMDRVLSNKFRKGLMKVAQSTGAWIVTGGTRAGVMQHVGRAVKTYSIRSANSNPVVLIGVASWGIVHERQELISPTAGGKYSSNKAWYVVPRDYKRVHKELAGSATYLDPFHTHFILVDNGTIGKFAVEIALRAKLEAEVAKKSPSKYDKSLHVPICCIILEGGPGSLATVMNAAQQGTAVIIAKGSGRVADVLAEAFEHVESEASKGLINEDGPIFDAAAEAVFRGKLAGLARNASEKQVTDWFNSLVLCMRFRGLMTVVNQDDDLDLAILRSLLNTKKDAVKEQLGLSIAWNRIDAAREILKSGVDQDKLKTVLADVALSAIIHNRVEFLRVFQDRGLKPQAFLSVFALMQLYNTIPSDSIIMKLFVKGRTDAIGLRHVGMLLNKLLGDLLGHPYMSDPRYCFVDFARFPASRSEQTSTPVKSKVESAASKTQRQSKLGGLLGSARHHEFVVSHPADRYETHFTYRDLMDVHQRLSLIAVHETETQHSETAKRHELVLAHFDDPSLDLFLYAVLLDQRELAMVFFEKVTEPLIALLIACKLCKGLLKFADDAQQRESLNESAEHYESVAIRLLQSCSRSLPSRAQALLIRKVHLLNERTCLQVAYDADCRAFIAQPCCQALLKRMWFGCISNTRLPGESYIAACCIMPPLIGTLDFHAVDVGAMVHPKSSGGASRSTRMDSGLDRSNRGQRTKRVIENDSDSMTDWIFNMPSFFSVPLVVFIYRLMSYLCFLTLLSYYTLVEYGSNIFDGGVVADIFLRIWMISFIAEEIIAINAVAGKWTYRVLKYLRNLWNRVMMAAIGTFLAAQLCLFISLIDLGRVFGALSVVLFYLRMLQWSGINKRLGPIIIVAGRMLVDLCFFMTLMFVLVFGWGVAQFSLLFPNSPARLSIIRDFLVLAYWQMQGDLRTDVIGQQPYDSYNMECTDDPELFGNYTMPRCPSPVGQAIVPVMLAIFVLCTNLLMFNLLIAIFNYSYEKVKEETEQYWCYQRYELITEFNKKPPAVPPFVFITYGFKIIKALIQGSEVTAYDHGGFRLNSEIILDPIDDAEVRMWLATQRDECVAEINEETKKLSKEGKADDEEE